MTIESLISNNQTVIHSETYRLTQPLSPHLSAKIDGIEIELNNFQLPKTENHLIVEGAGGLMVPLNDKALILDLVKYLKLEVIVVSQHYLGSINHTLLTINTLKQHNMSIRGIIFNGEENLESQSYILNYSDIKHLGNIPTLRNIDKLNVIEEGKNITL